MERTIRFYQDLLEFPLTDLFENRDYEGSTHFFFDIGNGNALAFFDFPDLGLADYAEVLGGLHHLAISVAPDRWEHLRGKLATAGVECLNIDSSLYFRDPDGTRVELINDPLGEMYGNAVLTRLRRTMVPAGGEKPAECTLLTARRARLACPLQGETPCESKRTRVSLACLTGDARQFQDRRRQAMRSPIAVTETVPHR